MRNLSVSKYKIKNKRKNERTKEKLIGVGEIINNHYSEWQRIGSCGESWSHTFLKDTAYSRMI